MIWGEGNDRLSALPSRLHARPPGRESSMAGTPFPPPPRAGRRKGILRETPDKTGVPVRTRSFFGQNREVCWAGVRSARARRIAALGLISGAASGGAPHTRTPKEAPTLLYRGSRSPACFRRLQSPFYWQLCRARGDQLGLGHLLLGAGPCRSLLHHSPAGLGAYILCGRRV